jgi:hypothetical protein
MTARAAGLLWRPEEKVADFLERAPSYIDDVECALAIGLMSVEAADVWRVTLALPAPGLDPRVDPVIFDAVMRARDRFRGMSASLERGAPKVGTSGQLRDLTLWEDALVGGRVLQAAGATQGPTSAPAAGETLRRGRKRQPLTTLKGQARPFGAGVLKPLRAGGVG